MRVLHVAAGNLYGGVERILVEIARATSGARHEYALSFEGRLSRELEAAGARRHDLGPVRFRRPLSTWRARRRLRGVIRTTAFDRVVCHSPWAYALAAPALRPAVPALWAHDALRGTHWTERRVLRLPPGLVICNSAYTEAAVAAWLPRADRPVVYAPVSAAVPSSSRAEVRAGLDTPPDAVVIVIVSRFERWKGHADLIRAAAGLAGGWMLWIVGAAQRPDEEAYRVELEALAAQSGIAGRVRFAGERTDVPAILAAADIHCQPNSAPEPFGLAFIEALHARLPVVTSDAGGPREIVTPACGVLVPPRDVAALRLALQDLLADPRRRADLGAGGPARARELCDPERQVALLERRLLPHDPRAAA